MSKTLTRTYSIPRKYDKVVTRTTQIPRVSIEKLINQMDSNNDGYITSQDIISFSEKHYLFLDPDLVHKMVKDAMSVRIVAFSEQLKEPINIEEILSAVQVHYTLGDDHIWVAREKPYRKYWAAGEDVPNRHDLPKPKITKILDMHEMPPPTFTPSLYTSQSITAITKEPSQRPEFTKNKPEAGLMLSQTNFINPVDTLQQTEVKDNINPFEKVINQKIKKSEQLFPTISFDTIKYYQEAEKLSRNPKSWINERNPILKFVPEFQDYPKQDTQDKKKSLQTTRNTFKSTPQLHRKRLKNKKLNLYFMPHFNLRMLKPLSIDQQHRNKKKRNNQMITHVFREDIIDHTKALFKTRIKPDPLANPHLMSEHDQRPQFAIEQDLIKQKKEEEAKQQVIDDYMGVFKQKKLWTKYFPQTDLNHNFVDHKRPPFLQKGEYQEPGMILMSLLREGMAVEDNFQLFHRQLRSTDKNQFLGEQIDF
ncbi:hypothetical protein pb186bvf_008273 [Paramecium bursaria]